MNSHAPFSCGRYTLINARVPVTLADGFELREHCAATGLATADIGVDEKGTLVGPELSGPCIDLAGRLVLPCFADAHVHLDKAFIVHRTGLPSGKLMSAVQLSVADMPRRTAEDLAERMERGLKRALLHGTAAIRTHLDTPDMPDASTAWAVFREMRETWRDRMELQGVALMALDRVDQPDFAERCRQLEGIEGVLGAFVAPGGATPQRLDSLFRHAERNGLDVDFHVDETLDPAVDGLEQIADSILRTGFAGRVLAGHCCALASKPEGELDRILDKVARAGIHVAALPYSNLFLQDREPGRTPRRRGITLMHELRVRGIGVLVASDNVRDPFFAYGDFDMVEVLRSAVRVAHLDHDIGGWLQALLTAAQPATGFTASGRISSGSPADLVLFEAHDWLDLLSLPHSDRVVIRGGSMIRPQPSDLGNRIAVELA